MTFNVSFWLYRLYQNLPIFPHFIKNANLLSIHKQILLRETKFEEIRIKDLVQILYLEHALHF